MIAEHEEDVCGTNEENERQGPTPIPDAGFKPRDDAHRADVREEERQEPAAPDVKEEADQHNIGREEAERDPTRLPFNRVIVKSEDDEEDGDGDGDRRGRSQTHSLLTPLSDSDDTSHSPDPDSDEHSKADGSEQYLHPEQQEWNFKVEQQGLEPSHVKEEEREYPCVKDEEEPEHLRIKEEDEEDITIIVKNEDEEARATPDDDDKKPDERAPHARAETFWMKRETSSPTKGLQLAP
ncbi:cilia- and flagella-associated protein 251-like isoform X5 [Phyllopteryx taeniolatus]|uniref:cilia- and flagella-associated protein 251-like isoform X5 n=1 Tax=Phyllopteryx taeniolatus TaxID=161469 RepID=UPI002AD28FE6|nr:cilia- and flagella-associated protein 251-like isoform X5 [Phyllopteryx taeniolatus]